MTDPDPKKHVHIDLFPWQFRYNADGRLLFWITLGYTHYYGFVN